VVVVMMIMMVHMLAMAACLWLVSGVGFAINAAIEATAAVWAVPSMYDGRRHGFVACITHNSHVTAAFCEPAGALLCHAELLSDAKLANVIHRAVGIAKCLALPNGLVRLAHCCMFLAAMGDVDSVPWCCAMMIVVSTAGCCTCTASKRDVVGVPC
jgi:hypothetical protein